MMRKSLLVGALLLAVVCSLPLLAAEQVFVKEIYFDLDKHAIKDDAKTVLNELVTFLNEHPVVVVYMEGHTCDIASAEYNKKLSDRRVNAASDYLISQGIPATRIVKESFGKEHPKYDNTTEESRRKNRRVIATIAIPSGDGVKTVYTSVIDMNGNFITDLGIDNFSVTQDDQSRNVVKVTYEVEAFPSSVGLVVDKSATMRPAIKDLKDAASRFIEMKRDRDRIFIVGFSSDIKVLRALDSDKDSLLTAIRKLQAGGHTRLYDALYESAGAMLLAPSPRIIVLLTDGKDQGGFMGLNEKGSDHTIEQALAEIKLRDITVYTIGLGPEIQPEILQRIARETNGAYYFAGDSKQLGEIYAKISRGTLRGKYRIDYQTPDAQVGKVSVNSKVGRVLGTIYK